MLPSVIRMKSNPTRPTKLLVFYRILGPW